jgi:hypothetical protein
MAAKLPSGWERAFERVYGSKLSLLFEKNGVAPSETASAAKERLAEHLREIALEFYQLGAFTHGMARQQQRQARNKGVDPALGLNGSILEGQVLGRDTMEESLKKLAPLLQEHEIPSEMRIEVQELHKAAASAYFNKGTRRSASTLANKRNRRMP